MYKWRNTCPDSIGKPSWAARLFNYGNTSKIYNFDYRFHFISCHDLWFQGIYIRTDHNVLAAILDSSTTGSLGPIKEPSWFYFSTFLVLSIFTCLFQVYSLFSPRPQQKQRFLHFFFPGVKHLNLFFFFDGSFNLLFFLAILGTKKRRKWN